LSSGSLPKISARNEIIIEETEVCRVNISMTTSSHDQYAAIQAAGLNGEYDILLGTGTAWVIDGISNRPVYDWNDFVVHPGRDIINDRYGYIMTLWAIGGEFDKLLADLNVDLRKISPQDWMKPGPIKDFMDQAASKVSFGLEKLGLKSKVEKIVMSGGAAANPYWPGAIANECGVVVKTVKFSEFTAYGAALLAAASAGFDKPKNSWPGGIEVVTFKPE
jgi:sugar (pentulose or hexulose) kinase